MLHCNIPTKNQHGAVVMQPMTYINEANHHPTTDKRHNK